MADTTGTGKERKKARKAARKTLGRRKSPEKTAKDQPRPAAQEPAAPKPSNGDEKLAGKGWDELADRAGEAARKASAEARRMAVDLSEGLDKAFGKLRTEAGHMLKKGQHTRVRIKFRGKEIAELPVAVVAAAEVASLWWAGPLRLLLAHVVGKAVLEVEFVSDAQSHVVAGRAFLSSGDLEDAIKEFNKAVEMDERNAGAHLGLGIALKLKGDKEAARRELLFAEECDPRGDAGREARRHLDNLA